MRSIKFKFWLEEKKQMTDSYSLDSLLNGGWYDIPKCKALQFTGLLDKNGVEIYEGDIVKYQFLSGFVAEDSLEDKSLEEDGIQRINKVIFNDGAFTPRDTGFYPDDGFYGWRTYNFEVIGNIYENPGLLK